MQRSHAALAFVLALVSVASWFARESLNRRVELFGHAQWVSTDPDTLYHVRRVERVVSEGLPVAEHDPLLNAPAGSAIPWPPYYTLLASAAVAPFAPADPAARRAWLEPAVASLACVFSVLCTASVALAAFYLVGPPLGLLAALVAGLLHALSPAAIAYGKVGNGDHHAFVSWLALLLVMLLGRGLTRRALVSARSALPWGLAAGVVAGVALGAWVASSMYIVQAQLVLGLLVIAHSRTPRPGAAALGLSFHLAALAVVAPAIASSPWREATPWSVVNLSWFHATFLAAGAAVFAPLAVLRAPSPFVRAWPWLVLALLVAAGAAAAWGSSEWALAVREGFAWAGRTDEFMARIGESRRLLGEGAGDALFAALGYSVLALPPALGWMAWRAWRERCLTLTLWTIATLSLCLQAASQARFAEALAAPLALVLSWAAARAAAGLGLHRTQGWRALTAALLLVALACLVQWPTLAKLTEQLDETKDAIKNERAATIGARLACDWIAKQPSLAAGESVLAAWGHGHVIEWAAQRASVATNFGAYVGERGFSAPSRWFMSEDEAGARAILDEHRVRFVLVDSDLPNMLNSLIEYGALERRERYVESGAERGGMVRPEWFLTLGARALFDGYIGPRGVEGAPFERLRLVWVAPIRDPSRPLRSPRDFAPASLVYEYVEGALVRAPGSPGEELVVELDLIFPTADKPLRWRGAATVGADGFAALRTPYATDGAATEARARGRARFTLGARRGEFDLAEADVREGRVVELNAR